MTNALVTLILISIFIGAITLSMLGYYVYVLQKNQTTNSIAVRNTINQKLDNLQGNVTKVLGVLANVTIHLANVTQSNNATLHQVLGNVSAPTPNATSSLLDQHR